MTRVPELNQHAVAGNLEDTTSVLGNERLACILAARLQCCERAGLILPHKTNVADHVGGEDGGETALARSSAMRSNCS